MALRRFPPITSPPTTGWVTAACAAGNTVVAGAQAAGSSDHVAPCSHGPGHHHAPQAQSVSNGTKRHVARRCDQQRLTYQWRKNGSLPGATNASLVLTNAKPEDAGAYDVVVSNFGGTVTSATRPHVDSTPSDRTVRRAGPVAGSAVTLTIVVRRGDHPLPVAQRWSEIGGATAPPGVGLVSTEMAGNYTVVVSDASASPALGRARDNRGNALHVLHTHRRIPDNRRRRWRGCGRALQCALRHRGRRRYPCRRQLAHTPEKYRRPAP